MPEKDEMVTVNRAQLNELIKQNQEYKADITAFVGIANGMCKALGIMEEDNKLKEEYLLPKSDPKAKNILQPLLKSIGKISSLATQAQMPIQRMAEPAKKELAATFNFLDPIAPLLKKYYNA